jgi:DNA-binding MarR family transcriptional regulator
METGRQIEGSFGKTEARLPFRSQSAEKLGKNYHRAKNMSMVLTYLAVTGFRMADGAAPKPIRTAITSDDGIDLSIIELFFFAYRDFTSDPDQILADYDFGRAHHRVLHFVNRMPGLTVAELLDVLKITKQSLARVLKQLIDTDHIIQVQGPRDRRQRELYPTAKGRALALALARPQSRRIHDALQGASADDRTAIERFLKAMVNPELRAQIDNLPADSAGKIAGRTHGDQ